MAPSHFVHILNISKLMELILFADDTNIIMSDKSLTNLNDKINSERRMVSIWFKLNKMSLNVKKTIL